MNELEFEERLINVLKTKGWENDILKHPTEEDIIKNWKNILFENNKEQYVLNNCPLTEGEMAQIINQVRRTSHGNYFF